MSDKVIRYARRDEKAKVVAFLRDHWDAEFSVVQSDALFEFLYGDGERINFVLALDGEDILATLGVTFYDETSPDVFLTLWKSIDKVGSSGIDLIKFVLDQGYRSVSSVGTRKEVLVIYRMLGFKVGPLGHAVRINPGLSDYRILRMNEGTDVPALRNDAPGELREVRAFSEAFSYFSQKDACPSPFKSQRYLTKRYLEHTHYQYRVFELRLNDAIENYFVTRTVRYGDATALRLVDCVADEAGFVAFAAHADRILSSEGHEYIDLYATNFSTETLSAASFLPVSEKEGIVAPNYFEPFLQQNETKHFVTTLDRPHLYKGDGDADRPYRLNWDKA